MRNRKYHYSLIFLAPVLLASCSPSRERVYVDIDKIPLTQPKPSTISVPKPNDSGSPTIASRSIPGEKSTEVENLRADEKRLIRQEIELETKSAIGTITERLQDFYKREVDEFYKTESEKLIPFKSQQQEEYLLKIRDIFEASAKKRGPVLTRLSFLTEFPPPQKLVPIDGEDLTKKEKAKRTEIRDLQRSIAEIDKEYAKEVEALDGEFSALFEQQVESLQDLLKQKQSEIDSRAADEATRLVRRFSSGLAERIFSRYTFQLKEIPTKTVNFPKIADQPGIPRVPFDRARLDKDDKIELTKELDTFLSLKRYERSPVSNGARDVTTEFIEWRTNLKSGHWEGWQKSSTPN